MNYQSEAATAFSRSVLDALDRLYRPQAAEAACEVTADDDPRGYSDWGMGHDAGMAGEPLDSCPFDVCDETMRAAEWQSGWHSAVYGGE